MRHLLEGGGGEGHLFQNLADTRRTYLMGGLLQGEVLVQEFMVIGQLIKSNG